MATTFTGRTKLTEYDKRVNRARELARIRKSAQRKRDRESGAMEEKKADNRRRCTKRENILRLVKMDEARPGCWPWDGAWRASKSGKAKPFMKVGEYDGLFADTAVWLMLGNKRLPAGRYLKTKCGHRDCISPEHLYESNDTLERALKLAALSGV